MTNAKAVYVLTTEEGTTETFTTIGALNKFAGIKATKAKIEAGEVANVTIEQPTLEVPEDIDNPPTGTPEPAYEEMPPTPEFIKVVEDAHKAHKEEQATLDLEEDDEFAGMEDKEEQDNFLRDHLEIVHVGDAPTKPLKLSGDMVEVDIEPKDEQVLTNTEDEDTEEVAPEDAEQLEYPEVGAFGTEAEYKKYAKGLTDEELAEWCELEGATYTPNNHVSINRMRMSMAIKAIHFPNTAPKAGKAKKKSKYGHYTIDQLAELAVDNDIEVRDSKGDARIERMYLIMALKSAGLIEEA